MAEAIKVETIQINAQWVLRQTSKIWRIRAQAKDGEIYWLMIHADLFPSFCEGVVKMRSRKPRRGSAAER